MRCGTCGGSLYCPSCGADVRSSQARWARRHELKGKCPRCGKPKTAKDGPHVNCFDCRRKNAERMRGRHATHGRKDRKAAA